MLQARAGVQSKANEHKERYLGVYRWMLLARVLEEKIASLYRGGKITGGVFLGRGQEALSAALGMALKKGDIFAPLIRDRPAASRLARASSMPPAPISAPGSGRCAAGMATSIAANPRRGTTR